MIEIKKEMKTSREQIGFECDFLENPPEYLQTECPICLHILREPYQVTCCGKSFCKLCIGMIRDVNKPCPCCKQDNFNDFPNKGLQQPLYAFKVYCVNKGKGCEWKGELGQLDNHLNNLQTGDTQLDGCKFVEVKCNYCSDVISRSKFLYHTNELCDKRPFSCEYCSNYKSTYDDVIHNHWPVCGCHPVRCPNECGAFPQRQNLKNHIDKDCPLALMECEFCYAGCEVKLPRRNMPDHLKDELVAHLSMLAASHKQQQEELKSLNIKHEEEIKELTRSHQDEIRILIERVGKVIKQTERVCSHIQIVPIEFSIENPRYNNWSSTPFYSHSQGYKLRLCFNYSDQRSSLQCNLMLGEFDTFLKWPLKALMTIVIYHPLEGDDYELSMSLDHKARLSDNSEIRYCGIMSLNIDINSYICDNCLKFRVVGVQLL